MFGKKREFNIENIKIARSKLASYSRGIEINKRTLKILKKLEWLMLFSGKEKYPEFIAHENRRSVYATGEGVKDKNKYACCSVINLPTDYPWAAEWLHTHTSATPEQTEQYAIDEEEYRRESGARGFHVY